MAYCVDCYHPLKKDQIRENPDGPSISNSEYIQRFAENIKRYIEKIDKDDTNYKAFIQGKTINLGLNGFSVDNHGECTQGVSNPLFCLESTEGLSPEMVETLREYNFLEYDGKSNKNSLHI